MLETDDEATHVRQDHESEFVEDSQPAQTEWYLYEAAEIVRDFDPYAWHPDDTQMYDCEETQFESNTYEEHNLRAKRYNMRH